jgi:hypothetical protein
MNTYILKDGENVSKRWFELVHLEAAKWGHSIYKVTGLQKPTRRSYVLWYCTHHPNGGKNFFIDEDPVLKKLKKKLNKFKRIR